MTPAQIAFAVLVPLLWGFQFVVIKVGVAAFPPLFFVGLRFAVVAAILLPFVGRPSGRETRAHDRYFRLRWRPELWLGLLRARPWTFQRRGHRHPAHDAFTLILAWPILSERPSLRITLGVVLAFGGVALSVADPSAAVRFIPSLLVVGSGLAMAAGTVLTKRFGPFKPLKLMAWMALFTVPQVLAASAVLEHGQLAAPP